jgi:hypothetical protein
VSIAIEELIAKRRPVNSGVSAKPLFHNLDREHTKATRPNRSPIGAPSMQKVVGMLGNSPKKPAVIKREKTPKPVSIELPKLVSRKAKPSKRYASVNPNRKQASSAAVRHSLQFHSLSSMIHNCSVEASFIDTDSDFKRKLQAQRARSKRILHSINDLEDCLQELESPCSMQDRLDTKLYNRMVDRSMEKKAPQMKQDCIAMSEYIASLGRTRGNIRRSPRHTQKEEA